jgi:hypothetical protein
MQVSPMFDRTLYEGESKFATQQLGFIQAIVQPLLEALCMHFPALRPRLVPRLERVVSYWLQVQATPEPTERPSRSRPSGSAGGSTRGIGKGRAS